MRDKLLIVIGLFIFSNCAHRKHVETEINNSEISSDTSLSDNNRDGYIEIAMIYSGLVVDKNSTEGCGWLIEIESEPGEKRLLEPLSLPESYQENGKSIRFSYTVSRRPSQCSLASQPIVIDQIIE